MTVTDEANGEARHERELRELRRFKSEVKVALENLNYRLSLPAGSDEPDDYDPYGGKP